MPYYSWQGIGLTGKMYRGKQFSRSAARLDEQLLKRDIALLSHKPAMTLLLPPIRRRDLVSFFERLAALLGSGVLLPEALAILADCSPSVRMQLMIEQVATDINEGHSLSKALEKHAAIVDPISIHLMAVGQEAGKLAVSLDALVGYQHSLQEFRKKMRSAALMPLISLAFFGAISSFIVLVMLPRLVAITGLSTEQLPALTRQLLWVSQAGQGWLWLFLVGGVVGIVAFGVRWFSRPQRRAFRDLVMLKVPFASDITIASQMGWFCAADSLLLRNGVPVVPALKIAQQMMSNERLKGMMRGVTEQVAAGRTVHQALATIPDRYCWPEVIAIIHVGEQTGQLAQSMEKSAELYHADAMRRLSIIATVLQPLMLVILGLLISLLIIAIYAPLFSFGEIGLR